MKKNTFARKHWHHLRANNQARRAKRSRLGWGYAALNVPSKRRPSKVQIWQGSDPEWAFCLHPPIQPPNPFSLNANREATFRLFHTMRVGFDKALQTNETFVSRPRPGSMPRIPTYFDFSKITDISTASAVILAAEYDRMRILQGVVPPTVDLDKWNGDVFTKLYQLGFFEITGHTPSNPTMLNSNGPSLSMRIVRSTAADDLRVIDLALQELFAFLGANNQSMDPIIIEFLTALSEAMTNVTNHAYTVGLPFVAPHVASFWVAATANQSDRTITIVVYDQGHTIPVTYPRMERLDKVKKFLARATGRGGSGNFVDDGTFIRAAMKFGGSRTDQRHRGRGFPQMFATLEKIGQGTLNVYSRAGWCERTSRNRMRSGSVRAPIGGTLVEWTVKIQ